MKWWPWRRRRINAEARQASVDAEDQLQAARERIPQIDRATRAAEELARRTNRFAQEVERSMRLRRGPTW